MATGQSGQIELSLSTIGELKIPVPPFDIQNKVCKAIEEIENAVHIKTEHIISLQHEIQNIISNVELQNNTTTKLRRIAAINPPKLSKEDYSSKTKVSFVEMASVNENGYIFKQENRDFGSVVSGSYKCFLENDIIIAKITPCMENGKCALATNLTNGIGFGSTEFHVIRADKTKILPKFLFLLLNREKIREEAKLRMTGKSGHRRVPESYYSDLDIVDVDITEQEKIVAQIEVLEKEIRTLESEISAADKQKKTVLNKYLF